MYYKSFKYFYKITDNVKFLKAWPFTRYSQIYIYEQDSTYDEPTTQT